MQLKLIFNIENYDCIYSSRYKIEGSVLNNYIQDQKINNDKIAEADKYPGTTFYINNNVNVKFNNEYNIGGVYHIKGWNHKLSKPKYDVENNEDYKIVVTAYYIAIMDHFFKNIENKKDKMSILHLIQCPGFLFGGTKITGDIFINTVYGYLFENRDKLKDLKFKISMDYKPDKIFSYKDYQSYKLFSK